MDTYVIVGIFSFFILLMIGRSVSEKSLKLLSKDEKVALLDSFSGYRKYYIIPIVVILAGYVALIRVFPGNTRVLMLGCFAVLSMYVLAVNVFIYNRLKETEISTEYLKKFMIARSLSFVGLIVLVVALVLREYMG